MAERLESDLAQQKGVHEHLDYLRKREALSFVGIIGASARKNATQLSAWRRMSYAS
jgi:hypothetical protein